jgi:hypothetical protein
MGVEMAVQLESKEADSSLVQPSNSYFRSKEFRSLFKNLAKSHDKYMHMKTSLYGQKGSGFGLNLCEAEMTSKIEKLVSVVHNEPSSSRMGGEELKKNDDDIGEKRKSLKERFFGSGSVESHRDRLLMDRSRESDSGTEEKEEEEDWLPEGLLVKNSPKKGRGRGKKGLNPSPQGGKSSTRGRGKSPRGRGRGATRARGSMSTAKRGRKKKIPIDVDSD